ncbi:MAG TPA: hypothetical protein VF745_13160 [Steroidobacteraceae bacterium]
MLRVDEPACSRPPLEERIVRAFTNRERLALYGDRRLGKSTLVARTLETHEIPCLTVDLLGLKSIEGLCAIIIDALEAHLRERSVVARKVAPWLREVGLDLPDMRLRLAAGPVHLQISSAGISPLNRLLDRIGQIAERIPLAVFFDEFQEIPDRLTAEDARHVLGTLRGKIQRQAKIAYYFAASAKISFAAMFTQEGAPFFEGAHLIEVDPIPERTFSHFLEEQFRQSGRPAAQETIQAILTLGGPRAADLQQLAHETWYAAHEIPVRPPAVAEGLRKIIRNLEPAALALLHRTTELQQRAIFAAALFQDADQSQQRTSQIAGFRAHHSYRKALAPFLGSGDSLPVLEDLGHGRIRFRYRYLRFWFLTQYARAINLLPVLRDVDYYRSLLPGEIKALLG